MLDEDNQMKLDLPARIPKDKEAEVLKQAEAKLPEGRSDPLRAGRGKGHRT